MHNSALVVSWSLQSPPPLAPDCDMLLGQLHTAVDYAFQPIVNIHTGSVYGYEALLRGVEKLGFDSVAALFQYAASKDLLPRLDRILRKKAFDKFAQFPNRPYHKLFFNLDPRALDPLGDDPQDTTEMLLACGCQPENVCLELSEQIDITANPHAAAVLDNYRKLGFQIAIDDFGTGFSGLKLLYEQPPAMLKIDRFFIAGIADNPKKRWFVSSIVQLAHILGCTVIAEGIETELELLACKDIGCDMAQGFFIARPTTLVAELRSHYAVILEVSQRNRRHVQSDRVLIEAYMERLPHLLVTAEMQVLFDTFRAHKAVSLLPILDEARQPLGVILESDIKDYIYSAYGRDLIANKCYRKGLRDFLRPCPTVDIHHSAQRLLEACAAHEASAGLIVTEDFRYLGFISAMSLLRLLDEKNLAQARDQNPLTKLPGNPAIHKYIADELCHSERDGCLVYFDFDNFKGFNDQYGFRRGDRAIVLFAELARKLLYSVPQHFLGHVGGDDFFAGMGELSHPSALAVISQLQAQFCEAVQSLYDVADRQQGFLNITDRHGQPQRIPFMRCSAAVLYLRREFKRDCSIEMVSAFMAEIKKQAKATKCGLKLQTYPDSLAQVAASDNAVPCLA